MFPRIGTRLRGKRHGSKSSGSSRKHPMTRIRNKIPDKDEQLSTLFFDEYWRLLWEKVPSERISGCVYYHPLCFANYTKSRSLTSLKKWICKEKVLSSRYLFIPMCESNHWNLLIICNIGEDLDSKMKSPCMLLLDSLQATEPGKLESTLRQFLYDIYQYGDRKEWCEEVMNIPLKIPKIPQQKDSARCGYYVLYYMFKFVMACPDHFNISEDYPGFMNKNWFNVDEVESFCEQFTSTEKELVLDEDSADRKEHSEGSVEVVNALNDRKELTKGKLSIVGIDFDNESGAEQDLQRGINVAENDESKRETTDTDLVQTNDFLQTPPEHDLFKSNDALRALVIYTPESSQEQQKIVLSSVPCDEKTPQEAVEKNEENVELIVEDFVEEPNTKLEGSNLEGDRKKRSLRKRKSAEVEKNDDDSDFEAPKKSQRRKGKAAILADKKKCKKRKAGKENESEEELKNVEKHMPRKILIRAYPSTFTNAIQELTDDQKDWVIKAGFGPLLSFAMKFVPHAMLVYALWWFDHTKNEMCFNDGKVSITEKDVADVLGLPRGEREILFKKDRAKLTEWRAHFQVKAEGKITELNVCEAITRSRMVDLQFKQNFMILMMNLFISTNKTSFVSQEVLGFDGDLDQTKEYNWCNLLIERLYSAHDLWWDNPESQYYTGSLVFLLFFYLDRSIHTEVKAERTRPVFIGWRDSLIRNRNKSELVDSTLGKGKIVGRFEKEEDIENRAEGVKICEENVMLSADVTADAKGFEDNDNLKTPKETIKGVHSTPMVSQGDVVNTGIISIVREIQNTHDSYDMLTEEAIMEKVKHDFADLKAAHDKCKESLIMAGAFFPENAELKEYENKFAKLNQSSCALKSVEPRSGRQFPREAGNEEGYVLERPRREQKVGEFQKSPFLDRIIDIDRTRLTKTEEEVWNWIIGNTSNPMQQIFFWEDIICMKHHLQTLKNNEKLSCGVIDVYASILNENEKYRSADTPRRFFCSTFTTLLTLSKRSQVQTESQDDAVIKFSRFRARLDMILMKHSVKIEDIDLIFFPIHDIDHYYVVCFNLKNPSIELIDNNKHGENSILIYDGYPESLKEHFVSYMKKTSPVKSNQLSSSPIVRLQMKWRTENNKVDCGVFVLHHMETYKGYGLRKWECKFGNEKSYQQERQLLRARQIYASKILCSPINSCREKMLKEIQSVSQN